MPRIIDNTIDFLEDRKTAIPPLVTIFALIGLGRVARIASIGLGALWVADRVRRYEKERAAQRPEQIVEEKIDTALEDSFPASDPPSYSATTVGTPDELDAPVAKPKPVQIH